MEKYLTNFNNKVENIIRYYDSNIHIFLVIFELAFFGYFWHFLDLKQFFFLVFLIGKHIVSISMAYFSELFPNEYLQISSLCKRQWQIQSHALLPEIY